MKFISKMVVSMATDLLLLLLLLLFVFMIFFLIFVQYTLILPTHTPIKSAMSSLLTIYYGVNATIIIFVFVLYYEIIIIIIIIIHLLFSSLSLFCYQFPRILTVLFFMRSLLILILSFHYCFY